ncbi:MAG: hybrid sensor histidine kinase/response regulator [Archangium sp.]|nr:hybrid sensor histidine kinase/response regulator [Archangium sp.]
MSGNLLIVDDSTHNLEILSTLLSAHGHQVRVASGGFEALRLARQSTPDLVLLDVHMPDLDGFEVCRALRETWDSSQLPVVFLSAAQDPVNRVKAFQLGAIDFVSKPFHFPEVLARVDTHLELKRRTEELEAANARLRAIEESRRQFITALVHDIKNPLTPLMKNTEWLLDQPLPGGEAVEVTRDLHVASHQLHRMVVSLLDVARSDEHPLTTRATTHSLAQWLDDALSLTRLQLRSQPGRLQLDVTDAEASFDGALLARVLQNLVDNALKYTPRKLPVSVSLSRDATTLRLVVEDRGAGIRPEDRERIFGAWTRLREDGGSGHGIGLSFCKHAVEAHGGTIRVEEAAPTGARFVVELPLN